MIKFNHNQIIYFLLVFLAIFTDSLFSEQYGFFGRSLLNMILPFCLILHILITRKFIIDKFSNYLLQILVYLCVICLVTNFLWIISGYSAIIFGENIWTKMFKELLYWSNIVIYVLLMKYYSQNLNSKELLMPFIFTASFLAIINLIEIIQIPRAFLFMHHAGNVNFYPRVRLTTTEASTTIPLIIVYGGFSIFYAFSIKRNVFLKLITTVIMAIFVLSSGSKTILFCIITTIIVVIYSSFHEVKRKSQMTFFLIIFLIGLAGILGVGRSVINIFNSNRSTSTYTIRTIPTIAALLTALRHPFGMGIVGKNALINFIKDIYIWMRNTSFGRTLGYRELQMVINENKDFGVIAGFFDYILEWGIVGAFMLIQAFKICYRKITKISCSEGIIIKCMYWCILFILLFTNPVKNYFMIWGFFVVGQELADRCFK